MKCSQCAADNTLKDRTDNNGCCKNCGHPFAYEPTAMPADKKFTDTFFKNVIETASVNYTLFFTPKQWLYLLDERLKNKQSVVAGYIGCFCFALFLSVQTLGISIPIITFLLIIASVRRSILQKFTVRQRKTITRSLQIFGLIILIFAMIYIINISNIYQFFLFALAIIVGMFSIYWGTVQRMQFYRLSQAFFISEEDLQNWSERWTQINGTIDKLLPPPRNENQPVLINPQVSYYSFDRAIICEKPEIAQFLIANNFHFENNCAILSINGYPQSVFTTVLEMLKRNPNLEVYGLHDASPQGVSLIHQLKTNPDWFANSSVKIYDIGILPRQIFNHPNCVILNSQSSATASQSLPMAIRQELMPKELTWLDQGNYVELESFTPQKLLLIASRGIALSRTGEIEVFADNSRFIFFCR